MQMQLPVLAALSLLGGPCGGPPFCSIHRPAPVPPRSTPAVLKLRWNGILKRPRRTMQPSSRIDAEESLTTTLRTLMRKYVD